jgi:putative Mg2+ transporter-C (MgtC) family protein
MASFAFTTTTGDSGRVAAQIVTGIGFLGAGVILHGRRVVSGMTTAAIIWMTAAIGMTVGAGYVVAGLGLSLLVRLLMSGIFLYETRWHPDLQDACVVIDFTLKGGITRIRLERVLVDYNLVGASAEWSGDSRDEGRLTLRARMARLHLYELLTELVDVPDVTGIAQTSCAVHKTGGNES